MGRTSMSAVALLLLLTAAFCNGCSDRKEFNQLALAQTVAIDYQESQYQVTVQLIIPSAGSEDITSDHIWIVDGQGVSVGDAIEQLARKAPREIYLDHLDLVLLGEGLLQHDVSQGLAYLKTQNVLRRRATLLTVQGNAGELLQAIPDLAEVDIYYLRNLVKDQRRQSKSSQVLINDYDLQCSNGLEETLVIPRVELEEKTTLQFQGAALVHAGKLLRWVEPEWLDNYRWMRGGQAVLTLKNENDDGQSITLHLKKKKCKWEVVRQTPLCVRAKLEAQAYIVDDSRQSKALAIAQTEPLDQRIQQQLEQEVQKQITQWIAQCQTQDGDVFHLGRWLSAWHSDVMQGQDWATVFSQMQIEPVVEATVLPYELR